MKPLLVDCDGVTPQRWRNAGGLTRELLAWPAGAAWRYRISVADIDSDAAFSTYPGVTRWFAVIEGSGVELDIDGARQRVSPDCPPLRFAGDAPVSCRLLDGPTRDLNLMLRDSDGLMRAARDGGAWAPPTGGCGLFATRAGRCWWSGEPIDGDPFVDMPRRTLLWFERAPRQLRFEAATPPADAVGWWLAADPR